MTPLRLLSLAYSVALLGGADLLRRKPKAASLKERLAAFPTGGLPLAHPVTIHWNDHQVPFVEAESDEDLAFALGMVHAHLRLAQMTMLRRIVEGRLAESVGPVAVDIDHALRILDFGRGAVMFEARMPPETRAFASAFARGINHYQGSLATGRLPHDFRVLRLGLEPWTVRDILGVGRLAGTDINWLGYFTLLKLRGRKDWPALFRRILDAGGNSSPSFEADTAGLLQRLLAGTSRNGSNAVAVSGARTESGAALLASDPHLGIQMPNLWLIAGMKSPSYHSVGFMIPGVPLVALGRNPAMAWGGTNMRAASSDLFDVSRLPPAAIVGAVERIKVRGSHTRRRRVRGSPLGPVISDMPFLKWRGRPFALRWIGHEHGDEITAFLNVQRARSWAEFRAAFATHAASAQNMLYADTKGEIGQVMAAMLPVRKAAVPQDIILDPGDPGQQWQAIANSLQLPAARNPASGFLASANNRPAELPFPIGYAFSADDRMIRMRGVLSGAGRIDLETLKALQRDVYVDSAVQLRDAYADAIRRSGAAAGAGPGGARVLELMARWDGHYAAARQEPVAFELFHVRFRRSYYVHRYGAAAADSLFAIAAMGRLLLDDLPRIPDHALAGLLRDALAEAGRTLGRFRNWGEMHRLALAHPLAFVPGLGKRYRFGDMPTGGSTESLMKTAHDGSDTRHVTRYGQQARFVADLADLDANHFLLLGGQDGWIGSTTALDQIPLWRGGGYIRMPLRLETVRAGFPHRMVLAPQR